MLYCVKQHKECDPLWSKQWKRTLILGKKIVFSLTLSDSVHACGKQTAISLFSCLYKCTTGSFCYCPQARFILSVRFPNAALSTTLCSSPEMPHPPVSLTPPLHHGRSISPPTHEENKHIYPSTEYCLCKYW